MDTISSLLSSTEELDKLVTKKTYITTKHQALAFDAWVSMGKPDKRKEKFVLFRLAKLNPIVFQKSMDDLHALDVDKKVVTDKFKYFLWFYKRNNNKKV
jgi:hypothetical protein